MRRLGRGALAGLLLRARHRRAAGEGGEGGGGPTARLVPPHRPDPRAEKVVAGLLGATAAGAVAFVVVFVTSAETPWLGLSMGLALSCLAAALIVSGRYLVTQRRATEERPPMRHPREADEVVQAVAETEEGISRRRLLRRAAGAAGLALGAAIVVPVAALGPSDAAREFRRSPWRKGVRLVSEDGAPLMADDLVIGSFLTAFPEGADKRELGSPVVLVRIPRDRVDLPADHRGWAPDGIMAYSKICTHAGCAIALFRAPLYPDRSPGYALVCPCHYSTFDVETGGEVEFGPASRPLPQLPIEVTAEGQIVATGPMVGGVGPTWWGSTG